MSVVDGSFGNPMRFEEEASAPLAGGIVNHGYQCGMLWGASLAAGAEVFRRFGSGAEAEATAIMVSKRLVKIFRKRTEGEADCADITELNLREMNGIAPMLKFLVKGGKVGPGACFRLAGNYARDVFNTINTVLHEEPVNMSTKPMSCAAEMARKMGATEKHMVMASGFAGGIGLIGGACGALGAAVWLKAMNCREGEVKKLTYSENPVYKIILDRFMQKTDSEFECREIVGRRFGGIDDHSSYLRDGGCSDIIEVLAGP